MANWVCEVVVRVFSNFSFIAFAPRLGRRSGTVGYPPRGQDDATAAANCGGVKVMARTRKTTMLVAAGVPVVGVAAFARWPRGPRQVL
jgi:hypothetical protein